MGYEPAVDSGYRLLMVFNEWSDAGSWMWASIEAQEKFKGLSFGYVQVEVPSEWRAPSEAWLKCSRAGTLVETVMNNMSNIGGNVVLGAC